MTTATLHANVQRSRFAHHLLTALSGLATSAWSLPLRAALPASGSSSTEAASLEAQKVRDLAYTYSKTDPGFAADLYAAAARHEGLYED